MLSWRIIFGMITVIILGLIACLVLLTYTMTEGQRRKEAHLLRCVQVEIGTMDECEFTYRSIGPEQFEQMLRENEAAKWKIGGQGQ